MEFGRADRTRGGEEGYIGKRREHSLAIPEPHRADKSWSKEEVRFAHEGKDDGRVHTRS